MGHLRTLYRRSTYFMGGRVLLLLLGFISFPVFTRVFSVADYGLISIINLTIIFLTSGAKLGLQFSAQRFYHEGETQSATQLTRYTSTLIVGTSLISAIACCGLTVGVFLVPDSLLSTPVKKALMAGLALIVVRNARTLITNLMSVRGDVISFNVLEVSSRAVSIGLILLALFLWRKSVAVFFLATTAGEAICLLAALPILVRRRLLSLTAFDSHLLRVFLAFGVPLMWTEIVWGILDSGDRYVVQFLMGSAAVGHYSAAYNLCKYIQDVMLAPVSMALFPMVMTIWTEKGKNDTEQFLSRTLDHFVLAGIGVLAATVLTAQDAIVILASAKYREAYALMPVILAGLVIGATESFFKAGLMIAKDSSSILKTTVIAAVVNLGINFVLIPFLGLQGAAIATLISYVVYVAMLARASAKHLHLKLRMATVKYVMAGALTVLLLRHVCIGNLYGRVFVTGTLALAVYFGVVALIHGEFRQLVFDAFKGKPSPTKNTPAGLP